MMFLMYWIFLTTILFLFLLISTIMILISISMYLLLYHAITTYLATSMLLSLETTHSKTHSLF